MKITILGPQASGKSTQAEILAQRLGYLWVSPGKILRRAYQEKTPWGLKAASFWLQGELVPDQLLHQIIEFWLKKRGYKKGDGVVIEGYPRDLNQLHSPYYRQLWGEMDLAIFLFLSRRQIMQRLEKRKRLEHRLDEKPSVIARRLAIYEANISPILEYYREMKILHELDGSPGIEEVAEAIWQIVTEYRQKRGEKKKK